MKDARNLDPRLRSSVFPRGAVLEGEIDGAGDLLVCGTIIGPIRLSGALTIEVGGLVRGNVAAHTIVIRGVLEGAAVGETVVRLEQGSRMIGDARAERVVLVDGALLRGRVTMGTRAEPASDVGSETRPEGVPAPRDRVVARAVDVRGGDTRNVERNVGARTRSRRFSELPSAPAAVEIGPQRNDDRWPQASEHEPQTRKLPATPARQLTELHNETHSEPRNETRSPRNETRSEVAEIAAPTAIAAPVVVVANEAPVVRAPVSDGPPPPRIPRLHAKRAKRKDEA